MRTFLEFIINTFNGINERVGRVVSWLNVVLVLIVCFNVVSRYFYEEADAWRGELEWHLFALIFLLGAGYSFKHERHVRVDLFYARYSKKDKAWTNLIGGLVFLVPWCILVIIFSWNFAVEAYLDNEGSSNTGGLKYLWPIKFAISIGIGLLLIQAFSSIAQSILALTSPSEPDQDIIE